jgi:hypothetical protein
MFLRGHALLGRIQSNFAVETDKMLRRRPSKWRGALLAALSTVDCLVGGGAVSTRNSARDPRWWL